METNSNQLFRKKSLEKIESSEKINSFIRVLSPGIWIVMIAIALVVIGILAWMFAGKINETINVNFRSLGYGGEVLYVSEQQIESIDYGCEINVDGQIGKVTGWSVEPELAGDVMDEYVLHINNFSPKDFVFQVRTNLMCMQGIHSAKITINQILPISFITGK